MVTEKSRWTSDFWKPRLSWRWIWWFPPNNCLQKSEVSHTPILHTTEYFNYFTCSVGWMERRLKKAAAISYWCRLPLCWRWIGKIPQPASLLGSYIHDWGFHYILLLCPINYLYFYFSLFISQLAGVIKPHDGQCHMDDLTPDESTGNIVYQEWNVQVLSVFRLDFFYLAKLILVHHRTIPQLAKLLRNWMSLMLFRSLLLWRVLVLFIR